MKRLLPAFLLIIVFGYVVHLKLELTDTSGIYYLLSAISQGLAAILAIILSAILVAGQLASHHSPELLGKALIKPFTISYILIFIISIMFPLLILTNREMVSSVIWVKPSLILAFACLVFLIPYFLFLKEQLDPKKLIDDLYEKASKEIRKRKDELPSEVSTIHNVVISLYNARNLEGYAHGIRSLSLLAGHIFVSLDLEQLKKDLEKTVRRIRDEDEGSEERAIVEIPRAVHELAGMFSHVGIIVKDDPFAARELVKGLGNCAILAEREEIERKALVGEIIERIEEVILRMEKQWEEAYFERAAYIIGGIGGDAIEKGQPTTTRRILRVLGTMASLSANNQWDKAARQSIIAIHSVGKKSIEAADRAPKLEGVSREAITQLGQGYGEAMEKGRFNPAGEAAWRIRDLGWKTLEKDLGSPFKEAIFRIGKIAETTITPGMEQRTRESIEALIGYGKEAVGKFPEEVAIRCLGWLTTIGSSVFKEYENLAQKVIEGIGTIGGEGGIMARKSEVMEEAITSLISLSEKLNRTKPRLSSLIAAQLWKLGGYAVGYLPEKQGAIKKGLNDIKTQIGDEALEEGFKDVKRWSFPPPWLSEFWEYYKGGCE